MTHTHNKTSEAERILHLCLSEGNGIFASPDRYLYQCWTRDVALAVAPLLLDTGESDIVRTHLENISKLQRPNGQIPILFLSDEIAWRRKKVAERGENSFMVSRYDDGELWNLTPGTKDSEILYVIAMYEYANATGDDSLLKQYGGVIQKAIVYVEQNNLNEKGLTVGADWRDTMEVFLSDRALLTNNVLLAHAYDLMGEGEKATTQRARVVEYFWRNGACVDYIPGGDWPDPLGIALAVLYDALPVGSKERVLELLRSVDTEYGVTIRCIHNPYAEGEAEVFERTQGEVIWPFVVGFSVMALYKLGYVDEARSLFQKMEDLDGFYEWYDPADGKGWGAKEQLWSATLYLRAKKYIGE
jgi:glycogen debranching enzyme